MPWRPTPFGRYTLAPVGQWQVVVLVCKYSIIAENLITINHSTVWKIGNRHPNGAKRCYALHVSLVIPKEMTNKLVQALLDLRE